MTTTNFNLCEILKGYEGTVFYSPCFGKVKIVSVLSDRVNASYINEDDNEVIISFKPDGSYLNPGVPMIYPLYEYSVNYSFEEGWNKWKEENENITYSDIQKKLFRDKDYYWLNGTGQIKFQSKYDVNKHEYYHHVNAITENQIKKLVAINKLMTVQKYIENGWQPDWNDQDQNKYQIILKNDKIITGYVTSLCTSPALFSCENNALKAIKILGHDTIKRALGTDW